MKRSRTSRDLVGLCPPSPEDSTRCPPIQSQHIDLLRQIPRGQARVAARWRSSQRPHLVTSIMTSAYPTCNNSQITTAAQGKQSEREILCNTTSVIGSQYCYPRHQCSSRSMESTKFSLAINNADVDLEASSWSFYVDYPAAAPACDAIDHHRIEGDEHHKVVREDMAGLVKEMERMLYFSGSSNNSNQQQQQQRKKKQKIFAVDACMPAGATTCAYARKAVAASTQTEIENNIMVIPCASSPVKDVCVVSKKWAATEIETPPAPFIVSPSW